jgi:hypothetical protein
VRAHATVVAGLMRARSVDGLAMAMLMVVSSLLFLSVMLLAWRSSW